MKDLIFTCDRDKILLSEYLKGKYISSRFLEKYFIKRRVSLNDKIIKKDKYIDRGDEISIEFEDEENNYPPINLNLRIVYEDDHLLVIDKPVGICMHSDNHEINLNNGISYLFKSRNLKRKVRFINRLDMNTSGLVMIGKNPIIQNYFDIKSDNIDKIYLGVVEGKLKEKAGRIELFLSQDPSKRYIENSEGKKSITEYKLVKEGTTNSLVEFKLITGRTHQIRASMAHLGNPLLGDGLYGSSNKSMENYLLKAYKLAFRPIYKDKKIELSTDLEWDLDKILNG